MEAPIITYVGEISEPRFRGILTSYAGLFVSLGFVLIYTLGNIAGWQQVAGLSSIVPIITIIAISQVQIKLICNYYYHKHRLSKWTDYMLIRCFMTLCRIKSCLFLFKYKNFILTTLK